MPENHRPLDDDSVGAATRALADATAALTRLLGRQVTSATADVVGETIATSLREAARGLATATEAVERKAAGVSRADELRRAKVDKTRADLLAAAERVFAARGYEGASVGDIAAEAGYTKGALYAHFGSKSELFLELARRGLQCPERPASPDSDLAEDLEAELRGTPPDDTSTLLTLELLAYAVRHPESRSELAPLFTAALEDLARRVAQDRHPRPPVLPVPPEPPAPGIPPVPAASPHDAPTLVPTQSDTDAALGVFAVTNVAAMLVTVIDKDATTRSARRLLDTLLDD